MSVGLALCVGAMTLLAASPPAHAAKCGNTSAGFNKWVEATKKEAARKGFSQRTINATLGNVSYRKNTIRLDRSQSSFKLSLKQFMQKRGANAIVSRGKKLKRQNSKLFANIERQYGVPPGVLLAIWGMETGFGGYTGKADIVTSLASLTHDCRRSGFFKPNLMAALLIIDKGWISRSRMRGARHGEIGQTQFLPSNYLRFAVDGDRNGRADLLRSRTDALMSTANYLRGYGWRRGGGYQPGQANFRVIQAWNAAGVYQKAIAIIALQIDS